MIVFAIAAVVLVAAAVAIVLRPLLKGGAPTGLARANANLDIYRDQFADLERDLQSGTLIPEQYENARLDLERRVLEESAEPSAEIPRVRGNRGVPIAIGMLIPVAVVLLYLHLGNLEALNAIPHAARDTSSITAEQFQNMTAKLAARMRSNPDDGEGWMMLGRAYRALERHQDAASAFEKAVALKSGDADLLADYAEALALARGRTLAGEPTRLLERALKIDPGNDKARALSGSAAFERKDYKVAIGYWESLLKQPGVSGELSKALTTGIAEARALSEGKKVAAVPAAVARVTGTVSLESSLRAQAAPEDAVFVFARAAQGPRMPLAVVKVKVKDLPYRFSLDDSMAMRPDMKLSAFAEVVVSARVSKSGSAAPAAGDLQGVSGTVKPGASGVRVAINEVVK